MVVRLVLRPLDRAADYAVALTPELTSPGNCSTCGVGQVLQRRPQRRVCKLDEARLSGPSLPVLIALAALSSNLSGSRIPTFPCWDSNPQPSDPKFEALTLHRHESFRNDVYSI